MSMPVEKARKVLQTYKKNNYNAEKSLIEVGYSRMTAEKKSGRTLDRAVNSLAQAGAHDELLEFAGLTSEDLAREYKSVITQNKNFPAKLRAMEPLLKKKGIQWDETKNVTTVPVLNLTVKDNGVAQQSATQSDVAQHVLCDTKDTAITIDNEEKI